MSDDTWLEELSVGFEPVGSWTFVAAVAVVLAVVLLATPPDRTRIDFRRRFMLTALRLGAFLALVGCMTRPTLVSSRKARQQGTVLMLVDASESMTVADESGGRTRWDGMAAALSSAAASARALVEQGGFEIAAWTFDRELHPMPDSTESSITLGAWTARKTSGETAIGGALDEALRLTAGRQIAGVIVLSDGAQHAYPPRDMPPQAAGRDLSELGVPLWSVTFGQQRGGGQGRDSVAVSLAADETVYLENVLEVAGRVRLEGLAGQPVDVVLLAEEQEGKLKEVARTTVRTPGEVGEQPVRLAWTPRSLGERKLTLRVEPQDGEVVLTNNELSTFVTVIDGGLRVLYLEGSLRVEQRFLRRTLAASPDIHVDFQWIDSSRREAWPVDLSRQLAAEYDVFLIGDLDSAALRPADLETILKRVESGAGIGLLGGFHSFEAGSWASSSLGPLMPFEIDRLGRQPFDEPVRAGLHLQGPLQMVPDSRFGGVSILRLGIDDAASQAAWQRVPPLAGANKLGRLVPTAKPLAVAANGAPLLVAREYGLGRVLAFAADSTWRWVMQGAGDQHRRFWRQLVLWLARKDDTESDAVWLRLAQRRLPPGAPLEFDVGITGADGEPRTDIAFEAMVVSPSGQSRPVRVVAAVEAFGGTVAECIEPGDWKLVVRASLPGVAEPRERSARFTVFRQDLELANPRANPLLMRQLAEATIGGVRLPEEVPGIFEELAARPAVYESREQWSFAPWNTPPTLLVMAAFLIAEWYLRKRWGLV
jgi:hypothetical protein